MFWLSPSAYWPCDCLKNHFLYITSCIKNGLFVKRTRDSSVSTFIKDKQFNMLNTKTFSVSLSQESHLLKLPRRMGEGGGEQTNKHFFLNHKHTCPFLPRAASNMTGTAEIPTLPWHQEVPNANSGSATDGPCNLECISGPLSFIFLVCGMKTVLTVLYCEKD